jgi:hypothetical protein
MKNDDYSYTNSVQLYKKIPLHIEAIQWDGSSEHFHNEILKFIPGDLLSYEDEFLNTEGFYIKTLHGDINVQKDDYIVRGIIGEFYPCKKDVFEASYSVSSWDFFNRRMAKHKFIFALFVFLCFIMMMFICMGWL